MDGNMQQPDREAAPRPPESRATVPLLNEYLSLMTSSNTFEAALGNVASLANAQRVYQLIASMDSSHWPTRERATQAAERMGWPAAAHLANARESGTLSLEQRRRVEGALEHIISAQPLQFLMSQLNNESTPRHLQSRIRDHVRSRLERNQPY